MSFWAYNVAAPKLWHTLGLTKVDFLRGRPASQPYDLPNCNRYRRLVADDMDVLSAFLRNNYGDADWYLDAGPWLQTYLNDSDVIVLGLFGKDDIMRGCIFSTPLSNNDTIVGKKHAFVRVIEGLCVHRSFRNTGVAAYLITAMDYETSQRGPVIHLYSRELPVTPLLSTHLNVKTYAYIECLVARKKTPIQEMDLATFAKLWASNSHQWSSGNVVGTTPCWRRGDIRTWVCGKTVIVVTDTRRRTRRDNQTIWETVWCGTTDQDQLYPTRVKHDELETVASMYKGILFTTMESFVAAGKRAPWHVGTSGVHAWYMYNFIIPNFGSCEIQAIREEL